MPTTSSTTPLKTVNGIKVDTSRIQTVNCKPYKAVRTVNYIVVHYTGNSKDTAENNAKYFQSEHFDMNGAKINASAHYFVDENSIFQSVNLRDIAYHCGTSGTYYHAGCRNANSIGIEMCCSGNFVVSDKTKVNTARLVANLFVLLKVGVEDVDRCLLRHWDITHKMCPMQMAGALNPEWLEFKAMVKDIMKKSLLVSEDDEMVEKSVMIVDGKEVQVSRILKDGTNYVKIRDIANALGLTISNIGSIAVLSKKE